MVERLILSRPAVEAGERLGFLPGDMREKVDPYLRPIYDALQDFMDPRMVERGMQTGMIEVAPLAFMRGRTLRNACVLLDEAQNATSMQMKMFLTRLGEGSRMIVTGDPTQTDLPPGQKSGLSEAIALLAGLEGVGHVTFQRSATSSATISCGASSAPMRRRRERRARRWLSRDRIATRTGRHEPCALKSRSNIARWTSWAISKPSSAQSLEAALAESGRTNRARAPRSACCFATMRASAN